MRLDAAQGLHLTELREADKADALAWLADPEIARWTLRIPHPYAGLDFDRFYALAREAEEAAGRTLVFAVRGADERLIGCIGLEGFSPGAHKAELGYWLARPFWGRGLMTEALKPVLRYCFATLRLAKLTAHVFVGNDASARVLEKLGFEREGMLRSHFKKEGRLLDAWAYGKRS